MSIADQGTLALISSEATASADRDQALAQDISQVSAVANDAAASVQDTSEAIATLDGQLSAQRVIKVQVDDNGSIYAAGLGIGVTQEGGQTQSRVYFLADNFALMRRSEEGRGGKR